ncbi:hypothetical protein K493DRAFT_355154 [Basidiobolus meristosporus CBS 931.73]|uniref:Sequence orphan n=1 Tax=Basidiobolus meristosporus CBS 931.73 TaxID=1314790 RepID=A0A1Y1Y1F1_9FUNG|nr:hypothetical protein K493DRAFT_355154 [Basidiobolus meristosporus CBS 931.73]|eukprot:ORX91842.1 hypothetical protein K493DRAFT_355154 [Basidiobolus meristosporus CBS 931.73]
MQLSFYCSSDEATCNKVKATFDTAFKLILNVVNLQETITVNASFVHFCKELGECNSQYRILGSAGPARTMIMTDDDGRRRSFPQALLKQQKLNRHPVYSKFDITAAFNADANFWLPADGRQITANRSDLLFVIVHELIHGLGLTSSWADYMNDVPQVLTPNILVSNTKNSIVFGGFFENAFDRYLVEYPSMRPITQITDELNQAFGGPGATFVSEAQFVSTFSVSSQYASGVRLFNLSTTPQSLAFLPKNNSISTEPIILETSLKPYAQGSSISHFDYKTYTNTADFLMRYMEDPGTTLEATIKKGGSYAGGPIGPQLTSILQTLGYEINPNPRPISEIIPSQSTVSSFATKSSIAPIPLILLIFTICLYIG